jgi:sporulation protein YunB
MRIRRRFPVRPANPFRWLLYAVLVLFFLSLPFLYSVENQAEEKLLDIARSEVKNITQSAVTQAVREVQRNYAKDLNNSLMVARDEQGRIQSVQVNQEVQAKLYETLTKTIQRELKKASQHKTIAIPLGTVFDSKLFADMGPNIPLKYWPKGSTHIEMEGTMESGGINMVMIKLNVRITSEMVILLPRHERTIRTRHSYPMGQLTIVGDVPEFYLGGQGGKSSIPVIPSR